ncbi:MAG TPA: hypothetical protein VN736_25865 [Candidatus Limnocylindrales bacterium]|nr:hypothetical protein [Candidatus Limnocylindrales bacterium]
MSAAAILIATAKFALWEGALGAAVAAWLGVEFTAESLLLFLCAEITLESSLAAAFSFTRTNSEPAYWGAALVCAAIAFAWRSRLKLPKLRLPWAPFAAALAAPLVLASFHPVSEIDSVNYLHYLIEWMANRATPYTFSTYYVAFWELSFLPAWVITKIDVFFPLIALKAVAVLALAAWVAGRELGLKRWRLMVTVAAASVLPHIWLEPSGVPTLKNDVLHGAGFVLLTIAVLRAARTSLSRRDVAILMFGAAFAPVKYTGAFLVVLACAAILWLRRRDGRRLVPIALAVAAFGLFTTWHYYVAHVVQYGNPFYPATVNAGPVHLPGEADVSGTSILDAIGSPVVWRALFVPEHGLSPGGLAFPLLFAAILLVAPILCFRRAPLRWAALLVCAGWFLYFRTYYGASQMPGDLVYMKYGLNTLRYVDGVWAVSLLILAATFRRIALPVMAIQLAACLAMLYARIPAAIYSPVAIVGIALVAFALARVPVLALAALLIAGPFAVEANRRIWNEQWRDLRPQLDALRGRGLATLTVEEAGYFAGHIAAAGNPVHPEVRSLLPEELAADHAPYVAVLAAPGAAPEWRLHYGKVLTAAGYKLRNSGVAGEIFESKRPGEFK